MMKTTSVLTTLVGFRLLLIKYLMVHSSFFFLIVLLGVSRSTVNRLTMTRSMISFACVARTDFYCLCLTSIPVDWLRIPESRNDNIAL